MHDFDRFGGSESTPLAGPVPQTRLASAFSTVFFSDACSFGQAVVFGGQWWVPSTTCHNVVVGSRKALVFSISPDPGVLATSHAWPVRKGTHHLVGNPKIRDQGQLIPVYRIPFPICHLVRKCRQPFKTTQQHTHHRPPNSGDFCALCRGPPPNPLISHYVRKRRKQTVKSLSGRHA